MHGDPEEAVLPPVGAPAVPPDPELLAGGLVPAPAHHGDLVVDLRPLQLLKQGELRSTWPGRLPHLGEDSALVLVKLGGGVHTAPDRAALPDFSFHVLCTAHVAVLLCKVPAQTKKT